MAHRPKQPIANNNIAIAIAINKQLWAQWKLLAGSVCTLATPPSESRTARI
jgi:hypothetical protein